MKKKLLSIVLVCLMLVGTLSVILLATGAEEEWSTWDGSSYDVSFFNDGTGEGTEAKPYKIASAAQWVGFVKWSNKEITSGVPELNDWYYFELTANLKFNEGNAAEWAAGTATPANTSLEPAFDEEKAGRWGIKFNGNGHTVSGVYMNKGVAIGLFGNLWGERDNAATTTVIENLILENSYFTGAGWVGSVLGETAGSTLLRNLYVAEDVYVNSTGNVSGGIVAGSYHTGPYLVTFDSCVFAGTLTSTGNNNGGIIGTGNSSKGKLHNILIENCMVLGEIKNGTQSSGFVGSNSNSATTTIRNSIYAGKGFGNYPFGQGTASGSVFTVENSYTTAWGLNGAAYKSKDSTESTDGVTLVTVEELTGRNAKKIIGFTRRDGEIMLPSGIIGEETTTLFGEGTEASPYKIGTADEWLTFITLAKTKNFEGEYLMLDADIDFTGVSVTPIVGFAGHLDGNGKTIKNLHMSGTGDVALFCAMGKGASVRNLKISASTFTADKNWIASVACCADQSITLENIYVDKDVVITAKADNGKGTAYVGGILGGTYGSVKNVEIKINGCVFAGTVIGKGDYAAGIISGINSGKSIVVNNCMNLGRVICDGNYAGGIAAGEGVTVQNCVNAGEVRGNKYTGGIYGGNPKSAVSVIGCYSTGSIESHNTDGGAEFTAEDNVANVDLISLIGSNATVPTGFAKRAGDLAVPATANELLPTLLTQQLYDGASVRFSTPTGLRFTAILGEDYLNQMKALGETEYGIIIAPTDYVQAAGSFTLSALDTLGQQVAYVIIPAEKLLGGGEGKGYYEFTGVLTDVQTYNYNREFSAIAYVKVGDTYYYSAYDEEYNARSIAYVAEKAYEDVHYEQTDYYTEEIAAGAGVYSPYSARQRETLLTFFGKEDTLDLNFLSYNVRNIEDANDGLFGSTIGETPYYEYDNRNEKVLAYLNGCGADIIGLQEVSSLKLSGGKLDWFDTLNRTGDGLTAQGYTCVKGMNTYTGEAHSASLVGAQKKTMFNPIYFKTDKFELIASGTKWLTATPDQASTIDGADTHKALNYVVLRHKESGKEFVYVNLHLIVKSEVKDDGTGVNFVSGTYNAETKTGISVQQLQVIYLRAILEDLQNQYDLPMFIGGDFNNSYSNITKWWNSSVVGETEADVKNGTPAEEIKISSASDLASAKTTGIASCAKGGKFDVAPATWAPIDLWYTSNMGDGFVACYEIVDNKFAEEGNRYPSDHLPAKLYVTLYL